MTLSALVSPQAGSLAGPGLDTLIRVEQIRAIYKNTPLVLISNAVIPSLLVYALRDHVARWMLLTWMTLMFSLVAWRAVALMLYRRAAPEQHTAQRWSVYLLVFAAISGSLWGVAGVMLSDPSSPLQFSLILLILAGLGAASVIAYAIYLPVFYVFFLPMLLPFTVSGLLSGTSLPLVMAIAALMYVGALSFFAHNLHNMLTESLRLRFENLGLVQALTVEKEAAERANAAKTRFLAAASHDLRQPLHAMGLFVSNLSERVRGTGTRKLVAQLSASMEALRGLLNALLDISRLDAGVIQPRIANCSLQLLFERLAHDYAVAAAQKKIALTFVPTDAWVRSDATLLERIVRNLVANAVRYTERGGVVVGCRRRGASQLRIEVWDTGIGIAAHELSNIFHEFYQVGNPERDRSKGLGLGLAIAQRLALLLDSRIDVVSEPGRGSMFALTAPRATAAGTETKAPAAPAPGRLRQALVVVIDDERAIREATKITLEGWGCETVLADSGETALAGLAQCGRSPDVILADYRLRSGETGAGAVEGLQAKYGRHIPAIIITGDTAPDRLREAEASGYHLLHKPLAPARLRALLAHVLAGPRDGQRERVV